MSLLDFEYAKNRFLNSRKVIDGSIYEKKPTTPNDKGEYLPVLRVAISMDTENKDKSVLYSDVMPDHATAIRYIASMPISN